MGGKVKPIDILTGGLTYVGRGVKEAFEPPDTSAADAMYAAQAKRTEKNIKTIKMQQFEANRTRTPSGVKTGGGKTVTSTPTLASFRPQGDSNQSLFE